MIKIEILGNYGEESFVCAANILNMLYMQRDVGHIFIIDELDFVDNIKYTYPVSILDNRKNEINIIDVFKDIIKTDERIFCIRKTHEKCKNFEDIEKYMQEIADNEYKDINKYQKTYCIYFRQEI